MTPRRRYFRWMGAYWSATPAQYAKLARSLDAGDGMPDLRALGVRELRRRPRGPVPSLRDAPGFLIPPGGRWAGGVG